tara:strand:- start:6715 stop:7059 length:345 start_codon:yes stop_codon:yes gene_type:complete
MSYELTGKVIKIGEIQTFKNDFTKVDVIIEVVSGDYTNPIKLETYKKVAARVVESLNVGDEITAQFSLKGSEYNEKYYTNLTLYKWDVISASELESVQDVVAQESQIVEDKMPF